MSYLCVSAALPRLASSERPKLFFAFSGLRRQCVQARRFTRFPSAACSLPGGPLSRPPASSFLLLFLYKEKHPPARLPLPSAADGLGPSPPFFGSSFPFRLPSRRVSVRSFPCSSVFSYPAPSAGPGRHTGHRLASPSPRPHRLSRASGHAKTVTVRRQSRFFCSVVQAVRITDRRYRMRHSRLRRRRGTWTDPRTEGF